MGFALKKFNTQNRIMAIWGRTTFYGGGYYKYNAGFACLNDHTKNVEHITGGRCIQCLEVLLQGGRLPDTQSKYDCIHYVYAALRC